VGEARAGKAESRGWRIRSSKGVWQSVKEMKSREDVGCFFWVFGKGLLEEKRRGFWF
jgi:hypothetical protein